MKLFKYITSATEGVQAAFFIFLIFVASTVAYFQGYTPTTPAEERTFKQHVFEFCKTFLSGALAFFFTLLIAESNQWDFAWTCLFGGLSVLFSKQFFEMLFNTVMTRVFGTLTPTSKINVPVEPPSKKE